MKLETLEPWVSRIGKDHIFRVAKTEENVFTRSYVPFNHGLHDSAKIAVSSCQNAENDHTKLRTLEL